LTNRKYWITDRTCGANAVTPTDTQTRAHPVRIPRYDGGDARRMKRPNPLSPDRMMVRERLAELCGLLALGLIRLRAQQSSQVFAPVGENCLHFPPDQSGHAKPKPRRTA
jgi:hypothetical protein